MKVAILGASGWIGSHILATANARGHEVTALVRDPNTITDKEVNIQQYDLSQPINTLREVLSNVDAVIVAIGGRALGNHDIVANTAKMLLAELPKMGVSRLLWVGGAGSLEASPGVTLVSLPNFPAEYKNEAIAQGQALTVFKTSQSDVNWTFISPAAQIFPGEAQGSYRIGADALITDDEGNSKISVTDYAKAMIDELENATYPNQRIGVAY
ncbi:NAD(P)-dependent oxidoreductase [Pseudoalteromonas tunicata]|jgi:putative NADH-flavin reductase|uniref:NAD(P)-binding domain-containing protein n=1 Tax=Pseudoalteromonas tunicata D2 TaxID=87626 RepID=A4CB11_9GAMM|nr:NAD(P)-dependent oxidoreductase [Pseudoalteromonas tunicata]ATC95112.1 hypothetical protein PTUN_a2659 [Pseudoalteromonas tunicata]AXT30744.1 NAD(P)-dependent oxidoreductase [Pseudoalteromonas tunicata]EAR28569.1 hypothetical protein PTD2_22177 [Pseudoalteromonas tunicata D2]MDP4985751.1 NAD(P)-dependent oxidoreductase [Pseudoalteromonas tunicata]